MTTPRPRQPPPRNEPQHAGAAPPARPPRPADPAPPPARFSARHLAALATRLTARDRWLIAMLHEHRVLTTHAIAHMAFTSDHRARRRLLQLHRWDVLERFAPRLPVGAAPLHYVLGPAGAAVLAAHHGLPLTALRLPARRRAGHRPPPHPRPHRRRQRPVRPPRPPHPSASRPCPDPVWTAGGPRPAAAASSDYVRPDAYARLTTRPSTATRTRPRHRRRRLVFEWFLELDFGTATLDTLAAKLDRYARLAAATRPRPLLIWLPTPAREAHARTRLTHARSGFEPRLLPVATSTAAIAALPRPSPAGTGPAITGPDDAEHAGRPVLGPADPVWLPLGVDQRVGRVDLAALARLWPASPGTTLAEETGLPNDASPDTDTDDITPRTLGAPRPLPPTVSNPGPPHGRR